MGNTKIEKWEKSKKNLKKLENCFFSFHSTENFNFPSISKIILFDNKNHPQISKFPSLDIPSAPSSSHTRPFNYTF